MDYRDEEYGIGFVLPAFNPFLYSVAMIGEPETTGTAGFAKSKNASRTVFGS